MAAESSQTVEIAIPDTVDRVRDRRDCVIAASAGTGKTFALEHLVLDQVVDKGTSIDDILVVTFTRRAAAEMKKRIRERLETMLEKYRAGDGDRADATWSVDAEAAEAIRDALRGLGDARVTTIHAFCQQLLEGHPVAADASVDTELVDRDSVFNDAFFHQLRTRFAREPVDRELLEAWLEDKDVSTLRERLSTLSSDDAELETFGVDPEAVAADVRSGGREESERGEWEVRTAVWKRFSDAVDREVERRKRAERLVTYDDLVERTAEAVEDPDTGLDQVIREQFDVALVDEFQDTSPAQWRIFERVFLESDEHGLFLIGDAKQSIFGFRGADLLAYDAAKSAVEAETGAEPVELEQNWRSTPRYIEAVNELFGDTYFAESGAADLEYDGVEHPGDENNAAQPRDWGKVGCVQDAPIELYDVTDEEGSERDRCIEFSANTIANLLDDGAAVRPGSTEGAERSELQPHDIFVLTRTNREAENVGEALRERGVPFLLFRPDGLFETDEAGDVQRLLRAMARPRDRSRRRKAYLTPFFDAELTDLESLDRFGRRGEGPQDLIETWAAEARRESFAQVAERALADSGLIRRELLRSEAYRRLTNYRQILEWAAREATTENLGLEALADRLEARRHGTSERNPEEDEDILNLETDRSAVRVTTIHKAKGLEAEVVFVVGGFSQRHSLQTTEYLRTFRRPNTEEGRSEPVAYHRHKKGDDYDSAGRCSDLNEAYRRVEAAEQRRLYYVAVTRAKSKAFLPYVTSAYEGRFEDDGTETWKIGPLLDRLDDLDFVRSPLFAMNDVDASGDEGDASSDEVDPGVAEGYVDGDDGGRRLDAESPLEVEWARNQTRRESFSTIEASLSGAEPVQKDFRLQAGQQAGNCIHGLLEEFDFARAEGMGAADVLDDSDNREEIEEALEKAGLETEPQQVEYVASILAAAANTALPVPESPSMATVAGEEADPLREMPFLLARTANDGGRDCRYVSGIVDVVFEWDGRIWLLDWKASTRIEGGTFERGHLERHVDAHYRPQAELYTLAAAAMLGIENGEEYDRKVGGWLYPFVRAWAGDAPDEEHPGVVAGETTWSRLEELKEKLGDVELEIGEIYA